MGVVPFLGNETDCPLIVRTYVSRGTGGGAHDAPAVQAEDVEQPTTARAPARIAATRPVRRTGFTALV